MTSLSSSKHVCHSINGYFVGEIDRTTINQATISTTSPAPPTPTVRTYATTLANGVIQTGLTTYQQVFRLPNTVASIPPSGTIGLGAIKGTIGITRDSVFTTVSVQS